MNVIIFIIRVLKLLFMHEKYFFLAFAVILVLASPVAGSLTKISAGAPVYLGEQNLDISAGLQGCRVIEWWEEGADTSGLASKNVTVIRTLEDSDIAFKYTIRPEVFSGYTGTWYCEEKKPQKPVFIVTEPQVAIRVWDLDSGTDVSGTTIPVTANITYRIETNIDTALQLKHRPDLTPADSFWTVRLTDPTGRGISNIYTGSYGAASTQILSFDSAPLVASSPYDWRSGSAWNRASRNAQGGLIYPLGTYTFTVSQNLNGMEAVYKSAGITETGGKLSHSTQVTFVAEPVVTSTPAVSPPPKTPQPGETAPTTQPAQTTPVETTHPALEPEPPVPERTTYAPLPGWIVLASLLMAGAYVAYRPR